MLEDYFFKNGYPVAALDGDEVRLRLSRGLGFSKQDRDENIRRIAYVARLITQVGGVAITSAISPYLSVREEARTEIGKFVEVYVDCPLNVCIERDVKGMYKKALRGEMKNFTGISDPYEEPVSPEVVVHTDLEQPSESLATILSGLVRLGYLARPQAEKKTISLAVDPIANLE